MQGLSWVEGHVDVATAQTVGPLLPHLFIPLFMVKLQVADFEGPGHVGKVHGTF